MTITQEELKRLLHYDPDTGVFTWRVGRSTVKVGDVAGSASKRNGSVSIRISINGRSYQAHWLAWLYMTGEFPSDGEIIKHVDDDGLDNRWNNLINANQVGIKKRNNKSGICGVSWDSKKRKWAAHIMINGKNKRLGYYDTIFEAACARKSAEANLK